MTYRELIEIYYPEALDNTSQGGVFWCPRHYFLGASNACDTDCTDCWNRQVEHTVDTAFHTELSRRRFGDAKPDVSKKGNDPVNKPSCCDTTKDRKKCWDREMEDNMQTDRTELFSSLTTRMAEVYEAKNHDYGNSYAVLRERYPQSILIRLYDKLNRLDTLISGEKAQVDESIEDTLIDIANYAIMELVERNIEKREDKHEKD